MLRLLFLDQNTPCICIFENPRQLKLSRNVDKVMHILSKVANYKCIRRNVEEDIYNILCISALPLFLFGLRSVVCIKFSMASAAMARTATVEVAEESRVVNFVDNLCTLPVLRPKFSQNYRYYLK